MSDTRAAGLCEAAEFLREEARDYATRAARLMTQDDPLDISADYTFVARILRRCGEILDERAAHGPQPTGKGMSK